MRIKLDAAHERFRDEVRGFLDKAVPADIRERCELGKRMTKDDYVRWQTILYKQGWVAPGWPKEHGGPGWTTLQRAIFDTELGATPAPPVIAFGVTMVGPVIIKFGSPAQKAHFLPRILKSEDWWCQGYSEPDAGSDLAGLKTRAVSDGDDYIVNGSKTWTTYAQYADMMFCLVRTGSDGKKQEGISFLLIDMHSPGVSVTPIVTIDGGAEINSVFFDNVRVPKANRIGEEGKGWTYAKYLLAHERTNIARVGLSTRLLRRLKEIAAQEQMDGRPLIEDPAFSSRIAAVEIDLMALEATVLRAVSGENAGKPPGPESSILKIKGSLIQEELTELMSEAAGVYALPYHPEWFEPGWNGETAGPAYAPALAPTYFNWRKVSIYGGSNEIQRNIIAKQMLGF
ncbi:MAG: pimeloyl-CoA dehydrogenase large subunit [Alphaproteobacteria bacterium]|nr:pimeloyl-CoA dehydrogenase large subunit [Alphaproteobacteria bacterium]